MITEERAGPERRSPLQWLTLGLRGCAMGIAELVPGVSGGTIAFVTGIYLELVQSLYRFDRTLAALLLRGRIVAAWQHVNATFLLVLLIGMGVAVVTFSGLVAWLFEHREIELWAFFFGLIIASAVFVGRSVTPWNVDRVAVALVGVLAGAVVSNAGGLPVSENPLVTFAAGAVAICAWILPGVSGSFVLLLLGQYQRVVRAIAELDLVVVASLGVGCVVGLALFTRALTWLLRHFYAGTLAFLCGFMVGALQKLWPWRQTLSYYMDSHGDAIPVVVRPIGPLRYEELYGDDPMLLGACLACVAGLALVMVFDLATSRGRSEP